MKSICRLTGCLLALFLAGFAFAAETNTPAASVEFVGTTPCDLLPRSFLGVERGEKIQWELTFFFDERTHQPSVYKLTATYGIQANNAPGFVNDGTTVRLRGTWEIIQGTKSDPRAVVYRINAEHGRTLSFVRLNDDLLHFLDQNKGLLIGSESWGYLLNRKGVGLEN